MTSPIIRRLLYALLVLLFALHNDLWLWNDAGRVLGLPVGLTYHLIFCVVTSAVLWLVVRHAWPHHLEPEGEAASERRETAR